VKDSIAIALIITFFFSQPCAVGAASFDSAENPNASTVQSKLPNLPFKPSDIVEALSAPPNVPPASQSLAVGFLDHTLPRLLNDDERLAHQLGFNDSLSNEIMIERVLSVMIIRRADLLEVVAGKRKPLELVNNINNWRQESGRLIPRRMVFLLKGLSIGSEADACSCSSITLEQSQEGSWRIFQVGAPKLSRAMNRYGKDNYFLVWLPDLNRHYLGKIIPTDDARLPKILLTALFDDRVIRVKDADGSRTREAGEIFDASSEEFFKRLRDLYEDLELPKKLPRKSDQDYQRP
jgi:hypothetical protein